jgi:polyhydroxyalkanoate synthesis regulator phasin
MTEDQERGRPSVGDEVREGIRAGIGILSALKDAIEETVQDMTDRGELSQDRAREAVRTTMDRAQSAFDDARVRLDFVPRREFEALKAEVADLRARLGRHETTHSGPEPSGSRSGTQAGTEPGSQSPPGSAPSSGATPGGEGYGDERAGGAGDIPITES